MSTLYAESLAAGLVTGSHGSDLYMRDTPEARALVSEHLTALALDWPQARRTRVVESFRDNVTGEPSLSVAFAYDPAFTQKGGQS